VCFSVRMNLIHQRPRHLMHIFIHDPNMQDYIEDCQEIVEACDRIFPLVRNGKEVKTNIHE